MFHRSTTMLVTLVITVVMATTATADTSAPADTLASTRMQQVVVTGTRSEKLLAETPVRTELITRQTIEGFQARSLADACEFTPGLRILNNCQNCNFTTLSMLGLEGKYSQVLYDGQPIFSSLALVYGLEQIPARMIERIEVVKGGGSSLYGPGAVGGVVNIIPRTPLRSGTAASASVEDMDGVTNYSVSFNADVVSDDGATAITVFGQGDQIDPYDRDGDGFTEIGRREATALGARVRRELPDHGQLTLDYSRIYENRRGGDQLDAPPFDTEITEWIRSWRNAVNSNWRQPWSDSFTTSLTLAYADTDRRTYYGSGGDTGAYGLTDNPLLVADAQASHYLGDHAITWGVQHSRDDLEDSHPSYDRVTEETYTNTGLYVQDDWQVSDPLVVVAGLRWDKHGELDDGVLSPRLAVRYDLAHDVTVRGSYSTGFLAPQVFDEDLHIAVAGGEAQVIRNDPDLVEESSRSYTLSIESPPPLAGGFGRFELNAFRTDLTDAFSLTDQRDDPATPETEFFRVNAGGAHVQGLEATVGWMNQALEVQLGWILQEGEFDEPQDFGETDFFRLPNSYGVLQARYIDPDLVDVFLGVRFMGEEKVPHYAGFIPEDRLETTDTFAVIDLSLTRRIPIGDDSLSITLGGRNVTDDFQNDFDSGPDRDTGYLYGPRQPRTWYATLGYEF